MAWLPVLLDTPLELWTLSVLTPWALAPAPSCCSPEGPAPQFHDSRLWMLGSRLSSFCREIESRSFFASKLSGK